jgi:hypothetical protein
MAKKKIEEVKIRLLDEVLCKRLQTRSETRRRMKCLHVPRTTLFILRGKNDELKMAMNTKLERHSAVRRDLEEQLVTNILLTEDKFLGATKTT